MNITMNIPQQGYVPRQSIDVDVYLSGNTENVYRVKVKLKKVCKTKAQICSKL